MNRTVKSAALKLPKEARPAFLEAWGQCDKMDLYNGVLNQYLRVIVWELHDRRTLITKLEGKLERAKSALEGP